MKKYRELGYRGYFGIDFDNEENARKAEKANKLRAIYNTKINTFRTKRGNDNFAKKMEEKIRKIFDN